MILTQQMFLSTEFSDDGLLFGLVFNGVRNGANNDLHGVTCQIYEKGNDGRDNVSIKSKAYQRFCIKNNRYLSFILFWFSSHFLNPISSVLFRDIAEFYVINNIRYEDVIILPEIVLDHPIFGTDTNSLSKLRLNSKMKSKLLKYESASLGWPSFVYNLYDVEHVIKRIKYFLATLKIGKWISRTQCQME